MVKNVEASRTDSEIEKEQFKLEKSGEIGSFKLEKSGEIGGFVRGVKRDSVTQKPTEVVRWPPHHVAVPIVAHDVIIPHHVPDNHLNAIDPSLELPPILRQPGKC